ncbi:Hypothetical Protein FCC1311_029832 [Hondaea fermentalgiana]|uniref:Uncharacterized protein n=1 Tax=Hondaea fermentalgiana TaxID=2315210 RepID=A0A2R5GET6_9STRA|nr:Hypothetical Protein FCC1311_029832 [Hondaea fermentalgiana]|eukprot:GBG26761.1 Hypothetical Protein FCC1311_029832 [Hondaea fermentalgiana]
MEDLATEVLEDIDFAPVLRGNVNAKHIVRKHVLQCGYLERLTEHGLSRELTGSSPWVKRYFGVRVLVSQAPSDGVLTARVELAYAKDEDEFIEGLIKSTIALEKGKTVIRLGLGRRSTMWIKTDSKCWTLRTKDIDWATYWALGLQGITGIEVETGSYMVWPYPRLRPAPSADIWLSVDPKMRSLRRLRENAQSPLSQDEETFVVQGALHDAKDILFRKNFLNGNVLRLKHHLSLGSAWVRRFFSLDAVVAKGSDGVATVQVELTYSETELDHAYNHVSRGLVLDRTVELELACTSGPILYLRKMGHKPWVLKFDKVRQAMYWTAGIEKVTGAPLESFKPVQWPYGSIKEPMSVDAWLESEEAAEVLSAEGRLVDVISSED